MHYPLFAYIIKFNQTRSVKYVNIHYYVMFLKLVLNFNNYYKSHHIYLKWKNCSLKYKFIFFLMQEHVILYCYNPPPPKNTNKTTIHNRTLIIMMESLFFNFSNQGHPYTCICTTKNNQNKTNKQTQQRQGTMPCLNAILGSRKAT